VLRLAARALAGPATVLALVTATLSAALIAGVATSAVAAPTPRPTITAPGGYDSGCGGAKRVCIGIGVGGTPGGSTPGHGGNGSTGGGGSSVPLTPATNCRYELMVPQPDKSFYAWQGHTTGSLYLKSCEQTGWSFVPYAPVWFADTPPAAPVVTPAQLAQQARAAIVAPDPVVHRSPAETNRDGGVPYTWVNLWTWYWTTPATWTPVSKTISLGGVSATVTLKPITMTLDPGTGQTAATCTGPGRPWTPADGNTAPSGGGCGLKYSQAANSVTSTVTVHWNASWTGTGGAGGTFPEITTASSSTFKVEQIQVVNR